MISFQGEGNRKIIEVRPMTPPISDTNFLFSLFKLIVMCLPKKGFLRVPTFLNSLCEAFWTEQYHQGTLCS